MSGLRDELVAALMDGQPERWDQHEAESVVDGLLPTIQEHIALVLDLAVAQILDGSPHAVAGGEVEHYLRGRVHAADVLQRHIANLREGR